MKAFKANKLAFAIAASLGAATLSPAVHAVNLAESDVGEVLIFPYYTVRGQVDSFVHITNITDRTVLFKITFREGYNTRDARDFLVALSPRDVWTAAITMGAAADGTPVARVQTLDNSCTIPNLIGPDETGPDGIQLVPGLPAGFTGVNFTNLDYTNPGTEGTNRADTGPTGLDRTMEGYVHVIAVGTAFAGAENVPGTLSFDAKHINGVPRDCAAVEARFPEVPLARVDPDVIDEFNEPENVLKGSGTLIDVDDGTAVGFEPTVLANFFNPCQTNAVKFGLPPSIVARTPRRLDYGSVISFDLAEELAEEISGIIQRDVSVNELIVETERCFDSGRAFYDGSSNLDLVMSAGSEDPDLANALPHWSTVYSDYVGPLTPITSVFGPAAGLIPEDFRGGIDAVSSVLMRTSVNNRWTTNAALQANSAWVVTFPTKNFYVDTAAPGWLYSFTGPSVSIPREPFTEPFQDNGRSCMLVTLAIANNEEGTEFDPISPGFSPRPPGTPADSICFETNVITFNNENTLGSNLAVNVDTSGVGTTQGVMELLFLNSPRTIKSTPFNGETDLGLFGEHNFFGLPVIGFALTNLENGQVLPELGLKLNYGRAWNHGYTRQITVFDPETGFDIPLVEYRGALATSL